VYCFHCDFSFCPQFWQNWGQVPAVWDILYSLRPSETSSCQYLVEGAVRLGPTKIHLASFGRPIWGGVESWGSLCTWGVLGTEDLDWLIFGKSINEGHKACMQMWHIFCSTLGTLSAMPAKAGWCHRIFIILYYINL
jgi:hypothetical protein